MQYVFLLR